MFRVQSQIAGAPVAHASRQVDAFIKRLRIIETAMDDQGKMDRGEQSRPQPEESVRLPMGRRFRLGFRSPWMKAAAVVAGLSFAVGAGIVVRLYHSVTHQVVIHYTTLFGIDRLGAWWWLVVMAAIPLVVVVFNLCLVILLREDQRFTLTLAAAVSAFVTGLVDFGLVLIVQANRTVLL